MSSESEQKYLEAKEALKKDTAIAAQVTPCVMITEQNWSAMVRTIRLIAAIMDLMVTSDEMKGHMESMGHLMAKQTSWLEEKDRSIAEHLESRSSKLMKDMEQQAGKLKEQYASDMEKAQKELQAQMDGQLQKMSRQFLTPALLLALDLAVFVLLRILEI